MSVGPLGLLLYLYVSRGCALRTCLWLPSVRASGATSNTFRPRLRRYSKYLPSAPSALLQIPSVRASGATSNTFRPRLRRYSKYLPSAPPALLQIPSVRASGATSNTFRPRLRRYFKYWSNGGCRSDCTSGVERLSFVTNITPVSIFDCTGLPCRLSTIVFTPR
jgi:hypothetical protein